MNIDYLIQAVENRLNALSLAKDQAFISGDLERVNSLSHEMDGVKDTLYKLNLLKTAMQVAADNNTSVQSMIVAGAETIKNAPDVPDSPTAVLSLYDLSTYAADPLYLQKITDILSVMPAMDTAAQIDAYIANEVIGSPLTGDMIIAATTNYNVDTRLTMAIMELDSQFGTAGVAVSTMNPGNVGNTGTSTKTFDSWAIGVAAVAAWLGNHRVTAAAVPAADTNTAAATSTPATSAATTTTTSTTAASSGATATTTASTTPTTPTTPTQVSTTTPDTTATSTPSSTATTTPDFNLGNATTTTDATATTTPAVASTTPSTIDLSGFSNATSTAATSTSPDPTPVIPPALDATTTPAVDPDATSTQAYNWFGGIKGKRRGV